MEDFFNEKPQIMEEQEVQKVKVGEEEFSQEELSRLVGLGKIGLEAEEKYNVTLDKVWQNHQRTINEKQELENELKGYEEEKVQANKSEEQISEEEARRQVLDGARKYGLLTKDEVNEHVANLFAARDLINNTSSFINKQVEDGRPNVSVDDLLSYMDEQGIKSPEAAYKLKFENELDKLKEERLASIKQPGMVTQQASTAGSKQPEPVKITKDNLESLLAARFN